MLLGKITPFSYVYVTKEESQLAAKYDIPYILLCAVCLKTVLETYFFTVTLSAGQKHYVLSSDIIGFAMFAIVICVLYYWGVLLINMLCLAYCDVQIAFFQLIAINVWFI